MFEAVLILVFVGLTQVVALWLGKRRKADNHVGQPDK